MIKNIITKFKVLPQNLLNNLPLVILGIFLFWITKVLFGDNTAFLSILFMLLTKDLYKTVFTLRNYLLNILMLVASIALGALCSTNIILTIVISPIFLFAIFYFISDDFLEHRYYVFGLSFLLVQMSGDPHLLLSEYALSFIFSAVICMLFLYFMNKFSKKKVHNKYIAVACNNIALQLKSLSKIDYSKQKPLERLNELTIKFCKNVYPNISMQGGVMDNKVKKDFLALIHLEQLSNLIDDTANKFQFFEDDDLNYFIVLQKLFSDNKNIKRLAMELNDFLEKYSLTNEEINATWKKHLLKLSEILRATVQPELSTRIKDVISFNLNLYKSRIGRDNLKFLSAIKKTIILSVSVVIATVFNGLLLENSFWLPLMVYSLLVLKNRFTFKKLLPRFAATLVGVACYSFFLDVLPFEFKLVISSLISFVVLSIANHPLIISIFASEFIMVSTISTSNSRVAVVLICVFAALGLVLAFLLDKLILRHRTDKHCVCWVKDVQKFDLAILNYFNKANLTELNNNYFLELLLKQYMLIDDINNHKNDMMQFDPDYYKALYEYNCLFLDDVNYALVNLDVKKIPQNWIMYSHKKLDRML